MNASRADDELHDHDHDRGLSYDLPRLVGRRALLGAVGLAGCG